MYQQACVMDWTNAEQKIVHLEKAYEEEPHFPFETKYTKGILVT